MSSKAGRTGSVDVDSVREDVLEAKMEDGYE